MVCCGPHLSVCSDDSSEWPSVSCLTIVTETDEIGSDFAKNHQRLEPIEPSVSIGSSSRLRCPLAGRAATYYLCRPSRRQSTAQEERRSMMWQMGATIGGSARLEETVLDRGEFVRCFRGTSVSWILSEYSVTGAAPSSSPWTKQRTVRICPSRFRDQTQPKCPQANMQFLLPG